MTALVKVIERALDKAMPEDWTCRTKDEIAADIARAAEAHIKAAPVYCSFCDGQGSVIIGVTDYGFNHARCRACRGRRTVPFAAEYPRVFVELFPPIASESEATT